MRSLHVEERRSARRPGWQIKLRRWPLAAGTAILAGCASVAGPTTTDLVRTQLLALLQTLNADLLGHASATLTLERWCSDHRLADPARIVARRVRGTPESIPDDLRARLAVDPRQRIAYRHVQLVCGKHVLSEADNWYVPDRLTAQMNQQLETTEAPFGRVVHRLDFQRHTLSAHLLWSPLPAAWEMSGDATPAKPRVPLRIPHAVLRHEAILYTSTHKPFSAVVETYTNEVFDFGPWAAYLESR